MGLVELIMFFAALGGVAGFCAGLLGIGGGIILVPGLYFGLMGLGADAIYLMHVAVGTSLAVIVPTGLSSAISHARNKAVQVRFIKQMGGGILIGAIGGAFIADQMSGLALKNSFGFLILILAFVMIFDPATRLKLSIQQSSLPMNSMAGAVIGVLASLIGIGGAVLSVPYMSFLRVPIHQAVGTAGALGLFISVPATLGFVVFGQDVDTALPMSLGYVNGLAWLMIVPMAVLMAPLGAYVTHKLPVTKLRFIFSALMIVVALNMLRGG